MNNVIKEFYGEIKKIDEEKYSGKVLDFRESKLYCIFNYYESFRKDMRRLYMAEESKPMDRHKIAANMMIAILKARPIKINLMIPNLPLELLLANEYLSFCCALDIVEIYRRDAGNEKFSLILPGTYIEEEDDRTSYIQNICKALYYIHKPSLSDTLAYANILFMIEKYTDTIYANE